VWETSQFNQREKTLIHAKTVSKGESQKIFSRQKLAKEKPMKNLLP